MTTVTALIAEDEPLLAQSLQRELTALWPELQTHIATDGLQAVELALSLLPQLLFFDVRMPGQSGLDAAQDIAERWPQDRRLPLLVFVTAFDEYAVQAFEQAAVDYVVKPVKTARLQHTLERIKPLALINAAQNAIDSVANDVADADQPWLDHLRTLLRTPPAGSATKPRLQRIQASVGNEIAIIPVSEVAYFEAADKYVRVLTVGNPERPARELLIRTPIKDLVSQLDPDEFWQIHRSIVVRATLIETVHRDETGRLSLRLRDRPERLTVSRLYANLFRAM